MSAPQNTSNLISTLNHFFAKVGVWSLKNRWLVLALCLTVLALCTWLAKDVRMNNSFDAYFNATDPAYQAYLQYRQDFGSDEVAYLLYDASKLEHGAFNLDLMRKISRLSQQLEDELPFVKDVDAINNVEVLIPVDDGIEILKLDDDFPQTQEQLLDFAEKFMSKDIYLNGYVSRDRSHGAIQIEMAKSSIDPIQEIRLDPERGDELENLYPQATESVLSNILAQEEYKDIRFYTSGDVPLNAIFNRIAMSDMGITMSATILLVSLLLLYFFNWSALGVLGPLSVVMLSVLITLGFMGAMNWDMDLMFSLVPTLVIAIGVAQAVHILSEFRISYAKLKDRQAAIKETLELVGTPCLLTSLTTAAGFLAMSISPIKTISHMAVYAGVAVLAAFFLSITLLMFFLSFGKAQDAEKIVRKNQNPNITALLEKIANITIRFPKQILAFFAAVFVVSIIGLNQVVVDSNFLTDFKKDEPIRVTTEYIDDTMGGTASLVYLFDSGKADGIKDPEVLREIERFQAVLNTKTAMVKKSYSIVDLIKDINQTFHEGDPAFYAIPESKELIAQYLLVYELSGGEEISSFISSDYSRANIEIRLRMVSSSEMAELKQTLDQYLETSPLIHTTSEATGIGALWIKLIDYITESQIKGVAFAFTVITLLMCLIFRSIKVGLISMIPNIAPALLTIGLIGWLGVHLDYTKLLVAPIAIGIAVDDTIHLLTRYHNEFHKHRDYKIALRESMTNVGRALYITSVVLVAGFSMFTLASLESQVWFGILLTLTIIIALIADFFVMPALILLTKPFGPESVPQENPEASA